MPQRLLRNSTAKVAELFQKTIMELANLRRGLVTPEFVLVALMEQKDSIALKVFDELRLNTNKLRRNIIDEVMRGINKLPPVEPGPQAAIKLSEEVAFLFQAAERNRQMFGDDYISTGALFLAFFDEKVPSTRELLEAFGLDYEKTRDTIKSIKGNTKITQKDAESRQTMIDQYTTDITAMARKGILDPVVGRGEEINRVIEILSRRKKNNPIIIGEPGVGKTVIVEGLAQQIVSGDVPEYLLNKRLLSLEIGSLIAGAKMQGEFEERLKMIKDEVIASSGEIILFIDEIHTVVGAGRSGGGLDASNMLKPALAKGLLQCIGATTLKEYKQYIEKDKALERRFQPVKVKEPNIEQTLEILEGVRDKYQKHHQIEYTDDALKAAAELSDRYITDRHLPDKAIDLIDEAGASKRLKVIYTPPELREIESKRNQLLTEKAEAFNEQDFEKMAHIQMQLSELEAKMTSLRETFLDSQKVEDRTVDKEDIASIVSRLTGIPVTKMVEEEAEKLIHLEEHLEKRVIGQRHAIESVSNAIRRNRSGLRKPGAPIASFLFLGPTGVGKTELAKALAAEVLDDENRIIRLDMSEYMEKHAVARLIGSPPGYVGYGEGGQLTEKVKQNPYSVVLLDEFEKAHPDVYNILLQVLDEGWLTDAEGQRVSFQNCIIIGTSNLGSSILTEKKQPIGLGVHEYEYSKDEENKEIMKEVKNYLRPEFINRIDEIIIFNKLLKDELKQILDIQINDLAKRLKNFGHTIEVTQKAKDYLIEGIEQLNYGARPLNRKLEQLVENEVASKLISKKDEKPAAIKVDLSGDKLDISIKGTVP